MSIKEFRDQGYLQEVNRQFLHPLGLALEITVDDETGECKLSGIWDCRNDPTGIVFDEVDVDKAVNVCRVQAKTWSKRLTSLGYFVQPLRKG